MDTFMFMMDGFTLASVLLTLGFTGLIALLFLHQQKFVRWSTPRTRVIACWMVIAVLLGGYLKAKHVDSVPYEDCGNMSVSDVQDWFVRHKEGKWSEHASAFSKLDGKELCAMVKEDFLRRVSTDGDVIYNDWRLATTPLFRRELNSIEFEIWVVLGILLVVSMGYLYYKSFVFELQDDDEAVNFWNALPGTVSSVGTIFEVPRLGKRNQSEKIFVRQCYQDLAEEIFKCELSAVVGTPGIGKSLFLQYFIAFLRAKGVKRIILVRPIEGMVYVFDGNFFARCELNVFYGSDYYKKDVSRNNETWLLFDATSADKEGPRLCACNMVVATSTKKENCQQYMKTLIERNQTGRFYMPVWSWQEIESVITLLELEEDSIEIVRDTFHKWGGVARFLFGGGDSPLGGRVNEAIRLCGDIDTLNGRMTRLEDLSSEDCHLVLHIIVKRQSNHPFTIDYKAPCVVWASERIEQSYMLAKSDNEYQARVNFVQQTAGRPMMSSARGQTFEVLAHERLLNGGEFDCKELGSRDTFRLKLPRMVHQPFHSFSDIAQVRAKCYYEPDYRTFPAIDSAMHRMLFQMTVGATHTINLPGCQRAVAKFGNPTRLKPKTDCIFVLPKDIYDTWGRPQGFVENGAAADGTGVEIRQVALCIHV